MAAFPGEGVFGVGTSPRAKGGTTVPSSGSLRRIRSTDDVFGDSFEPPSEKVWEGGVYERADGARAVAISFGKEGDKARWFVATSAGHYEFRIGNRPFGDLYTPSPLKQPSDVLLQPESKPIPGPVLALVTPVILEAYPLDEAFRQFGAWHTQHRHRFLHNDGVQQAFVSWRRMQPGTYQRR